MYIESIVFVSISIALYGLIIFYTITKSEVRSSLVAVTLIQLKSDLA